MTDIETVKSMVEQAHDQSLDGLHLHSRDTLRSAIDLLSQMQRTPQAEPIQTDGHSVVGVGLPSQAVRTSGDGEELKRYDFDWTYVGIESKQNEYGEWVRYVDALAFYSKELDRVHAEGRAVSLAKPFWTVFNGDGAVIGDDMTLEGVRECLTPARCARGWNAVYTFVVTKPEDLPNE